ncbi:unnamed protein product [Schistosoma margrebowiei]|uniref:Uncharacterized protein n=1 Tax=Schistosoma margrebowiei TaxID=48269 RepID=A0A183MZU0_9TREM|nr:unnamed protein product [Schistosoma margrebowiei]
MSHLILLNGFPYPAVKPFGTMDDSNIAPLTTGELQWLANLESDDQFGFREAFINCCLNDGDSETKACLISVCNRLKLPKILESVTTDG